MTVTPITAVLLDIDGTLLDSNDAHARSWVEALRQHGHAVPYARVRPLIGKGGDKLLPELAGLSDDGPEGRRITETRKRIFMRKYLPTLRPTRGARALLEQLREEGLDLIVATSSGAKELQALLKQAGIADLIDSCVTADDAGRSKPDPDVVQAALREARVAPARAMMLGDTPYDIAAARQAGVGIVALRCGGWWGNDALAGALAIYDDPADLLQRWQDSPLAAARIVQSI